jgi:hypothetical protein
VTRRIYAKPGERIFCQRGHYVATVARVIHDGDLFDAGMIRSPAAGIVFTGEADLFCPCGSPFSKTALHGDELVGGFFFEAEGFRFQCLAEC